MANLRVRKLDEWVLEVHRRLAKNERDSLENHVRQLLAAAAIEVACSPKLVPCDMRVP